MPVVIYHNPRCSKSRQALALLQEQGVEPRVVPYLKEPLDAKGLDRLLALLKMEPRDLMRKKEPEYKALNLADASLTREQLIQAMVAHPQLMERPIVVSADGKRAVVARPTEALLGVLQGPVA